MAHDQKFAEVILDQAVNKSLDYHIESDQEVEVGCRVEVPLKGTWQSGTVIRIKTETECRRTFPIKKVGLKVSPDLFALAEWMSQYYMTPLRYVMKTLLPSVIRKEQGHKTQLLIERSLPPHKIAEIYPTLPKPQAQVIDLFLSQPKGILLTELLEKASVSRSPVETLIKKKILSSREVIIDRSPFQDADYFISGPKTLSSEQKKALDSILSEEKTHLIHGVTGSGKTEIYLQAIQAMRDQGKGVIVLVPEIVLTTQTIERFKSRFKEPIGVLHHRLSEGERFDQWQAIHRGELSIVIGARSAVFCPVNNLGLIIVDEEHDTSYKQTDQMPCYQARDVAVMRGFKLKIPVILGSATPSLESYYNALNGKYLLHHLSKRAAEATLPEVILAPNKGLFSEELLDALKVRSEKGEQSLLFLNRRGYHAALMCTACGESVSCSHCDIALTFHKSEKKLSCHLCGFTTTPPSTCPECKQSAYLKFKGAGTELVEASLHAILPTIRTLRIDADTTKHKGSHDKLIKQFRAGKADVLIGTQMIAKGLHFPSVTLVGILNADAALSIPDFRATEYVFQLLTQVAGRSGRGELAGQVILQTNLEHQVAIKAAMTEDYTLFYQEEIEVRKYFGYPPFERLIKISFSGESEEEVIKAAHVVHEELVKKLPSTTTIYPPTPAGHVKVKDRFRYKIVVKGGRIPPLISPSPKVSLLIDVDPCSLY
ncbi:MAG: primosomal protein N' [Simkaniaceae bacterium]|nr:primosomal protein N' [Simkaniaceae bacterium]